MGILERLQQAEIFKDLTQEQLERLQPGCEERSYGAGERLFAEGEEATLLWIVTAGQVDLRFELPGRETSPESTILTVGEGQVLGWSSFVPPHQYKLSAYCATGSCSVVCVDKKFLEDLFLRHPSMGYRIVTYLTGVASTHLENLQKSGGDMATSLTTVTVHMATCGIAAGAREVMLALTEETGRLNRKDIQVKSGRCIGQCKTEPNVTVEITGQGPVVYQKMTADKMREVFQKHVLGGEAVKDYVLDTNP
jgi:NADP-reducing hydrogenase subunit HndB